MNTQIDSLSVDLSALTILDSNTESQITDMGDSIDLIDFDGLITALDVDTATADFAALTTALQGAINDIDNSGVNSLGAVRVRYLLVHCKHEKFQFSSHIATRTRNKQAFYPPLKVITFNL